MNIFVGCGARDNGYPWYRDTISKLAHFIAEENHNLVFGGSDRGIMGLVYSIVISSKNSKVYVSMCNAYKDQLNGLKYEKLILYETVNERKNGYIKLSDALVFIPGGFGTVDELMGVIEAKRAKEHNLPIVIINICDYFNPLLEMFEKFYNEGFADESIRRLYFVANSANDAIEYLKQQFPNN